MEQNVFLSQNTVEHWNNTVSGHFVRSSVVQYMSVNYPVLFAKHHHIQFNNTI